MKRLIPFLCVFFSVSSLAAISEDRPDDGKLADIRVLEIVSADDTAVTIQDTETKKEWKVSKATFGPDFDFRPGYQFAWTAKDLERASLSPKKAGKSRKARK